MKRLGAAALAACLLVVGCDSEPEPRFAEPTSDPTSVETSATTTPTTSPPTTTPPTQEPVVLGPEETVRAWVKAFNVAATSGKVDGLRALSASDCLQCNQFADGYTRIYGDGGSVETKGWRVVRVKRLPEFASTGEVGVFIRSTGGVAVDRAGAPPVTDPPKDLIMSWFLQRREGNWLVHELRILS